ncbi:MAG TPA: ribonuclease III domain-containing protein [Methylomirabilota bacterium]|nr:ribonuclease III domain-containing protein [Methylomirabilota bacterium]
MDASGVVGLERRLGHRFLDPALLERALTHASYAHEHPPSANHDRLAFLGDAVLGLVVAEHVIAADPDAPVGVLTPRRAEVVSSARLARFALVLELPPLLRLGRGEEQTGGRERESILATTLEAVLGAVYLDGGLDAARTAIGRVTAW